MGNFPFLFRFAHKTRKLHLVRMEKKEKTLGLAIFQINVALMILKLMYMGNNII